MRYPMRLSSLGKPLLALFGGIQSQSYVDRIGGSIRFKFGMFDQSFSVADISVAESTEVPLIAGLGWKLGFGGSVGLLGSQKGVVKVTLREPRKVSFMFIPFRARSIYVSLQDPQAFIADLEQELKAYHAG
jgi:hypothetical protein